MVDIYLFNIVSSQKPTESYCLQHFKERYKKSFDFRFVEDRYRSIGVGYLLYEILGLNEEDIKITDNGKPYSEITNKYFSISHSGNYVVLAVCDYEVGVDIEVIDERHLGVADRVYCDEEIEWINNGDISRFFKLWTIKESVVKILGTGISYPVKTFNALPIFDGESIVVENRKIYGKSITVENSILSVCTQDYNEEIEIHNTNF